MLSLLFLSFSSFALTLGPKPVSSVDQSHPVIQSLLTQLKPYGEFSTKTETKTVMEKKELSRGEQMIEEAKARNRALLQAKQNKEKEQTKKESKLSGMDLWREQAEQTQNAWAEEVKNQRAQWQKEQDIFLGKIKVYKENTFKIPVKVETIIEKKIESKVPEILVVGGALDVPIRDQEARPTCAAFAGIRSLEVLAAQNGKDLDLSEQYLYWASKPDCQQSPCQSKGSWVTTGFQYSMKQTRVDIPQEKVCAYNKNTQNSNETQIPLGPDCQMGEVQVESFTPVKTLTDVLQTLKSNLPVILAIKLTENFYLNQGLVTLENQNVGGKLDEHSLGHAVLAVGILELPVKMKEKEGSYCLIVANSWGLGWGAGGHACLTESWLLRNRMSASFVAVNRLKLKN